MFWLSKIKVNINTDTACNYTQIGNLQFDGCGLMWDLKIKSFPIKCGNHYFNVKLYMQKKGN